MIYRCILILTLCLLYNYGSGQTKLDTTLINKIEKRVVKKAKQLRRQLVADGVTHPIYLEYAIDEFRIEEYISNRTKFDFSTATYVSQTLLAEKRYQVLISKYYNKLIKKLLPEDAAKLDKSHALWMGYKKHEQDLNKRINPELYSKSKDIGLELVAERHLNITKYRLLELVDYIARIKPD